MSRLFYNIYADDDEQFLGTVAVPVVPNIDERGEYPARRAVTIATEILPCADTEGGVHAVMSSEKMFYLKGLNLTEDDKEGRLAMSYTVSEAIEAVIG